MTAKKESVEPKSSDQNPLRIWDKLSRTDPAHTKGFQRKGGFKGTAIKPIYQVKKMTEVFGPAGEGWSIEHPSFEETKTDNGEILVFCTVRISFPLQDPERMNGQVVGVGGDYVAKLNKEGQLVTSDEAYKMAFTDAVGNAMKYLGMSADIHMGLFDDSKYVQEVAQEVAQVKAVEAAAKDPELRPEAIDAFSIELTTKIAACATTDEVSKLFGENKERLTKIKVVDQETVNRLTALFQKRRTALATPASAE